MSSVQSDLQHAVDEATQHRAACEAVRNIYTRLQSEIDRRKPVCVASGKCCHFESYGHRLYVTTLELAAFVEDVKSLNVTRASGPCEPRGTFKKLDVLTHHTRAGGAGGPCHGDACPLQVDGLCSVHAIRPFGCRIFFCDPTADEWQKLQYELFHAELKQLHERFEIPYLYLEWRTALAAIQNAELLTTDEHR